MCGISCIVALREHTKTWDRPTRPSAFQTSLFEDPALKRSSEFDNPFPQMERSTSRGYERQRVYQDLQASLDKIQHRGPDSRNHWISEDTRVGKITILTFNHCKRIHVSNDYIQLLVTLDCPSTTSHPTALSRFTHPTARSTLSSMASSTTTTASARKSKTPRITSSAAKVTARSSSRCTCTTA